MKILVLLKRLSGAMARIVVLVAVQMVLTGVVAHAASWSGAASLATARFAHSATLLQNGKVLVAGGYNGINSLASAELYDPATNSWSVAGSMATARYAHSATALPGGKVLVAGGYGAGTGGYVASAELYDPATNSWSAAGSLATARYTHSATLLPGGKVLVAGGYNGINSLASAELYDPATNSWSAAGLMATERDYHTATLLPNGKVLVVGGYNDGGSLASAELYDPAMNSWSAAGSLATARRSHTATLLPSGKVLVAGGTGPGGFLASAELYDLATNSWSTAGSLVTARYFHTATLLPSGRVLMAGGTGDGYVASAELYDPATNSWSAAGSMATARGSHSATLLPSSKVLFAGGYNYGAQASAELYDPATNSWSAAGSLATARQERNSILLPSGKVLVAGGSSTGYLTSAELYDPSTNSWSAAGSMATARDQHSATLLPGGKVLMAGGGYAGGYLASAELYDPATNSWSAAGSLATARDYHSATLLPNGKVLVAGGYNSSGGFLASAELYDPAANSWSATGSLATARCYHSATLLPSGKVLVVGGRTSAGYIPSAELYDPATNSWSPAGSPAAARSMHSATLLPTSKVLVVGGYNGTESLTSAEWYDPATNSWSVAGSLATGRYAHTATLLPSGKVLVAGGDLAGSQLVSVELYDPANNSWNTTNSLATARYYHSATLLPNGKVLTAGGYNSSSGFLASAELYDPGLGFSDARRSVVSGITNTADRLAVSGTGFRGDSEASSGGTGTSPTNYPLLQLRRIDNEQSQFIASDPSQNWSDTAFTSASVGSLLPGQYSATIYANAIPSMSRMFLIGSSAGVAPLSADFGSVPTSQTSAPQIFTISNSGNQDLVVSSIATTGGDSAMFSITPGTCPNLTPTIAAGGNCTVSVTFTPTSTGAKATTLRISSNDPVASIKDMALSGTGIVPTYALTLTVTGSGVVHSTPLPDINCTGACGQSYDSGTVVTLTATPGTNNSFAGWSGACGGVGQCQLTMDGARNVTATFVANASEITNGLIGRWRADGNANDSAGANNGTLTGGATYTTGMNGQAFSFNGTNGFQAPTTGLPTGGSNRTLSLWVKIDSFVAMEALFAGYGGFSSSGDAYALGCSGQTLFFSQWGSGIGGPSLESGRWYHVAVTNSGNSATLYLDGVSVGTGSLPMNTAGNSTLFVGYKDSDRRLAGSIDDVRIFNRTLDPGEIAAIRQAGIANSLMVYVSGTGSGDVTPDTGTLTWSGSTGTATYDSATTVTLTATPAAGSIFSGWNGCPSVSGNQCTVTAAGLKSLSAYFNLTAGSSVKVGSNYYGTLSGGHAGVSDGGEIDLKAGDFYEALVFNRPVSFKLKGGFTSDFLSVAGLSTIHGSVTIASGTLTVDGITIQ